MSHLASLPISNLDRLNRMVSKGEHMVPKKEDGGMITGRALPLPMKGLPQKNPREREIKSVPVNRGFGFGEAVLKKKGGLASHPQETLLKASGKKFHH